MQQAEKFKTLGIKPPKGCLMYGPPGTGKTLLARACAAQTNACYLKLAGPSLVQMYIGDGAKLVRDAFELAKQKAPAIIFIDELDAVGTKRFDSNKAGDREVQRTMLELLNQLDGFSSDERIKVIAATNRIDILDPALLRSGRLDRKIEFPLPNESARERILQIHARKLNHKGVNFEELARSTEDMNGAQLKAVCVEAGMNATQLSHEHFMGGILEVQARKAKEHHGQEVSYYVSLDGEFTNAKERRRFRHLSPHAHLASPLHADVADSIPPGRIEHTSLPSGLHQRDQDLVTFTHCGLPGAGLFRSRAQESGRGRRMGTLGVVLATGTDVFELEGPLEDLYDRLEGVSDPFEDDGTDKAAVKALLDEVWANSKAKNREAPEPQSAKTLAGMLSKRIRHPITYMPALLGMMGPELITVYKASLAGQRISHTDAYDMFIDMSDVLSVLGDIDVRSLDKFQSPPPILQCQPEVGKKPSTRVVTYSFADLGLYRSLVLLDQSPRGVRATTVGFTATNRSGGMWLVVFELLESMWHLCVGVCDFALGRGRVGIQLEDSEDARLLRDADVHSLLDNYDDEDDIAMSTEPDDGSIPDDTARRGRLILDQFHHNAYHLYARLISVSAGSWELTPAQLKELTGRWTGGNEEERQWLALARNWNVEPAIGSENTEGGASVSEQ
ncbi:endopeptidase [Trichosporon asahii var. asahii CBS 2479]|uniref:26S proteasome regulatory subunit 6B homolog n=1 Tax=Trichosporon asahii var. asahii (strain ATCC 90039 / CBS 2479 / JCM 2466 / KCTC 7840 / NBRC 103889/ NCYC 2677 / UAMH 7654) TaxID=1186058 RepID=J5QZ75_TRIAS|nr:endopeptidase [Trichosporon asahii var. asahii CBS 2479]EJT49883.1 endopeptidase [Trichosporon asahii var. asahii CBS 2479]